MSVTTQQILKETNERIYQRNLPSTPIQAYLSPRPIGLKQSYFPVSTPPVSPDGFTIEPIFQPCSMFQPGDGAGPWSGYATNITTEDYLRTPRIPSSQSDLYRVEWESGPTETRAGLGLGKHALLNTGFELPQLPRPPVSGSIFNHSTRHAIQPEIGTYHF
jgi:hypothetical protein